MPRLNLVGKRFGRLLVISLHSVVDKKASFFLCRCDCGVEKVIRGSYLSLGETHSCGCLKRETASKMGAGTKKHGMWQSKEYRTWRGILDRCLNENNHGFPNYGGRGITVCKRWLKFENFYKDMGNKPRGFTIERRDNNVGYCKENCYWGTRKQQQRNRRKTLFVEWQGRKRALSELCEERGINYQTAYSRYREGKNIEDVLDSRHHEYFQENNPRAKYITYKGETRTVSEWARELGMEPGTLNSRLACGWSVEDALTTTPSKHNKLRNVRKARKP